MNPIIVIPARMASTRLPGKPLADIAGEAMIVRVWRRAVEAGTGPVVVAAAEREIADAVARAGGEAVLTDPELPSGSDRVFQALQRIDPAIAYDVVVNLQGDLPAIAPDDIAACVRAFMHRGDDIGTLAAPTGSAEDRANPNVTKAIVAWEDGGEFGRALYFTRAPAPWGEGAVFHHIGIYAYRRPALARFVGLAPSPLERREKLEQLRALEAGMTIAVARVNEVPLSVDTPEDLARARTLLAR